MTKHEFLDALLSELSAMNVTVKDAESSFAYYAEMIDDRVEDGLSEEEAVKELGSPRSAAREIMLELPMTTLIKSKCKRKKPLAVWETVLLILGFPIWFPLLATVFALALSLYIVLWSVILTVWAADLALAAISVGSAVFGIMHASDGIGTVLLYLGTAVFSAGAAGLLFFGCRNLTVLFARLTPKLTRAIKSLFIRKNKTAECDAV